MTTYELDVRLIPRPEKHGTIFATFDALAPGEAFVLVNDHDPVPLRRQFDRDYARGYGWEYLAEEPEWRIRITKLTSTPLPQRLTDTADLAAATPAPDAFGAIWRLGVAERDLDANVIALAPGGEIAEHAGGELDVLVHVIAGSGRILTERDALPVAAGSLVWLPRRSRRGFEAGEDGLRYLTVHRHKTGLEIRPMR